ncbi:MAG: FG-GAP-like repeat-containing protein, partial [Candidatus Hydrothermia bacterium]
VNFTFLKGTDTVGIDTAGFDVYAPVLRKWVRQLDVDSLSLLARLKPGIANKGWADAKSITMTLTSPSPGITIIDGTASVNKIGKRAYLEPWNSSDGFTFRFSGMSALEGAELVVTISDPYGPLDTLHYTIHRNLPETGRLWGAPDSASIALFWEPPYGESSYGYLVYRADNILGPYKLVSYDPPSVASFTDYTVQPYRLYYYRVSVIDSFYNPGPFSEPVMLATYLKKEPPWPMLIPGAYQAAPVMCDLDPSYPKTEMVVAGGNATVYAFHYDGTPVSGWPVVLDTIGGLGNDMACGDIDGDGKPEIAVRMWRNDLLFVLRSNGTMMPGWPKQVGWSQDMTMAPCMADLDNDGKLEIICTRGDIIYAFRYNGTGFLEPSGLFFRHPLGNGNFGSPSVADVDQDGNLEIVAGFQKPANSEIWVLRTNGTPMTGFPCFLGRGTVGPALAIGDLITNILGDEIIVLASNGGSMKTVFCIGSNGQILWTKDAAYGVEYAAVPSLGDVDNDGAPEVLVVGERKLLVYDADGTPMLAYQTTLKSAHYTSVTSADVDGDGKVEYFVGDYGGFLYGLREGGYVEGFPIPLGLYNIAVPQLGEFDNDGMAEIVQLNANNYLYAFQFYKGPPKWSKMDWRTYKHDNWRTGWLGADSIIAKQEAQWNIAGTGKQMPELSWGPTITRGGGSVALNLKGESRVCFRVYDPSGRMVEEPCSGTLSAGFHWISWGKELPSGLYFLRLEIDDQTHATKSLILR